MLKEWLCFNHESNFSHNSAVEHGGMMEVDNRTVRVGGVTHTSFRYLPATFEVSQSLFMNNQASDGGVFYLHREGSKIQVTGSSFGHNHAIFFGGVLSIDGASLIVNKTSIYNNTARRGNTISTCNSNITLSSSETYNKLSHRENKWRIAFFMIIYDHPVSYRAHYYIASTAIVESTTTVTIESNSTVIIEPSTTEVVEPSTTVVPTSSIAPSEVPSISSAILVYLRQKQALALQVSH